MEEIVCLFLDGIYLGVRGNSREREAVLVAHGINREGKRVVLRISLGGRESTESWKVIAGASLTSDIAYFRFYGRNAGRRRWCKLREGTISLVEIRDGELVGLPQPTRSRSK